MSTFKNVLENLQNLYDACMQNNIIIQYYECGMMKFHRGDNIQSLDRESYPRCGFHYSTRVCKE